MGINTQTSQSIVYFEREGRENLTQVLRVVKRAFRKRVELRSLKIVVFTAIGEGPALSYNLLQEYTPQIIAVTFPSDFYIVREGKKICPNIPDKIQALFDGLGIKVIRSRLPFEEIDGVPGYNEQMKLIKDSLSVFGGGFVPCIQAVLQACDHDAIRVGEKVISITGDSAAIITASTTKTFLSKESGLVVNEILCKARNLTIARGSQPKTPEPAASLFDLKAEVKATKRKELSQPGPKILEAKE